MAERVANVWTAIFNRYAGLSFVVIWVIGIISMQLSWYWLEPVAHILYVGFWTLRPTVRPLLGSTFVAQVVVVWAWFHVYTLLVAIGVGTIVRQAAVAQE